MKPKTYFDAIVITTKSRADLMAGLVVKLGLGRNQPSYVNPGNSGSAVGLLLVNPNPRKFQQTGLEVQHAL